MTFPNVSGMIRAKSEKTSYTEKEGHDMNPYEKYYLRQRILTGVIAVGAVALVAGGLMLWQPWNKEPVEEQIETPVVQDTPVQEEVQQPDLTITVGGKKVDCRLYRGDGWTMPVPMDWTIEEDGDAVSFIPPASTSDGTCLTVSVSQKPAYSGEFISAGVQDFGGESGFERLFYTGDARGYDVSCKMKSEEDIETHEKTMTAMARTMTVGDERPFASLYPMASQPEWQVVDGETVLFLDKDGIDLESVAEAAVRSYMSGWSNEKKALFTGQYRFAPAQWVQSYTCVVEDYVDVFTVSAEYQVVSGGASSVDLAEEQQIRNGWLSDAGRVLYVAVFHDGSAVTNTVTVWGKPGYNGAEFVSDVIAR